MKTVFTNGVWDIFHYGHYNLLRRAKEYGDYLLVGVASDESCIKYKRRPHQPWEIRANSVSNLSFVNEVIKTEWSRDLKEDFYREYEIDIQVQGDDSSGFQLAKKLGLLKTVGRTKGISTTRIEKEIRSKDNKKLSGGYINEIKQAFADNKLYVIKTAKERKGKLYDIDAPLSRIYNEYESIMAFRELLRNPPYIANPICFDPDSYTIVFESAPKQAKLLSNQLICNEIDFDLIKKITKSLVAMHNATLDNKKLAKSFSNTEGFIQLKINTQCLHVTKETKLQGEIRRFIEESLKIKKVLLHGDIAPKNILVWDNKFLLIDFEESAYSDPALDIGYFLAHFYLYRSKEAIKLVYDTYMSGIKYDDETFEKRVSKYAGIFILSRVDGKAKADYIKEKEKNSLRELSKKLIYGYKDII